jgi:predicted nucleic acid-binding protein
MPDPAGSFPVLEARTLRRLTSTRRIWTRDYSLSTCISMNAMHERGLVEVLTNDAHFSEEGFIVLCEPTS